MLSEIRHNSEPKKPRAEVALTALDIQSEVKLIAGYREGDTTERRIRRVQRTIRVSYWTARDLWYGAIKDPRGSIIEKVEAAKSEATRNADKLESAARALEAIDADFHGAEIHRLRDTALRLRGVPSG